eukprot:4479069-Prymnesium_polylepis.1
MVAAGAPSERGVAGRQQPRDDSGRARMSLWRARLAAWYCALASRVSARRVPRLRARGPWPLECRQSRGRLNGYEIRPREKLEPVEVSKGCRNHQDAACFFRKDFTLIFTSPAGWPRCEV